MNRIEKENKLLVFMIFCVVSYKKVCILGFGC